MKIADIYISTIIFCFSTNAVSNEIKPLLCATFIDLEKDVAVQNLIENIKYAQSSCNSWAAVSYKPNTPVLAEKALSINTELAEASVRSGTHFFFIFHMPWFYYKGQKHALKPALYFLLLPHLPYYKRVWLIDEDFSLQHFKFQEYFSYLNCPSSPLKLSLVTQPLIRGHSDLGYVQMDNWTSYANVVAVPTGYVEQQVPIIDTKFFEWFVERIIVSISKHLRFHSDWGHDECWCKAAKQFHVMNKNLEENQSFNYSCSLLIMGASSYVTHLNFQTLDKKYADTVRFWRIGLEYREKYLSKFPKLFAHQINNTLYEDKSQWLNISAGKDICHNEQVT